LSIKKKLWERAPEGKSAFMGYCPIQVPRPGRDLNVLKIAGKKVRDFWVRSRTIWFDPENAERCQRGGPLLFQKKAGLRKSSNKETHRERRGLKRGEEPSFMRGKEVCREWQRDWKVHHPVEERLYGGERPWSNRLMRKKRFLGPQQRV